MAHSIFRYLDASDLRLLKTFLFPNNCSHRQRGKIRPQGADPLVKGLLSTSLLPYPPLAPLPIYIAQCLSFPICEVEAALGRDSILPPRDDLGEGEVMSGQAGRAAEAS